MADEEFQQLPDHPEFIQAIRVLGQGQTLFNRYTLNRLIGSGGMGLVWAAQDHELGEEIALKFLPERLHLDATSLEELKRETRRSRKLAHPNIVKVYDFVSDGSAAAISMELVDGDTLSGMRARQPELFFEVAEMEDWVRQLLNALNYAHVEARIVHRDLKPANIMVDSEGRVKVTDFGIASSISESLSRVTLQRATSGTLAYMSPQQAIGAPPSAQDDIYALGATLFELLTSKPPFYHGDVLTQLWEIAPPSMAQRRADLGIEGLAIPDEWEQTVAACLAKNPEDRPQSAAEVSAYLGFTALPEAPSEAPPPEVETEAPPPPRSRRGSVAALGVALIALLLGGSDYYFGILVPAQKAQALKIARQQEAARQSAEDQKAALLEKQKEAAAVSLALDQEKALKKAREDAAARIAADKAAEQAKAVADQARKKKANDDAATQAKIDEQKAAEKTKPTQLPLAVAPTPPTAIAPATAPTLAPMAGATKAASPPSAASKDASLAPAAAVGPFMSSLGVKFVPAGTDGVLFSVWDVRVKDYAAFVNDTGQNWFKPDFAQTDNDPAVKVSWDDAKAFCAWLTKIDRAGGKLASDQEYRLPTDAEWSKAVGLNEPHGVTPGELSDKIPGVFPWGTAKIPPSGAGNYAGEEQENRDNGLPPDFLIGFKDDFTDTSPVGSFSPNSYGIYDLGGNVWQWCEDKIDDHSDSRVTRGASWLDSVTANMLSSHRNPVDPGTHAATIGFRVVMAVDHNAPSQDVPGSPPAAQDASRKAEAFVPIDLQTLSFDYADGDSVMRPYPKGHHEGSNPVQETDSPADVIQHRPVYFDESTGDAVDFRVGSSQQITKLIYSGTGYSGFVIEALDSGGNVLASAGPFNDGSVHKVVELDLPKLTHFVLSIHDKSGTWLLIENIHFEGTASTNSVPFNLPPSTETLP